MIVFGVEGILVLNSLASAFLPLGFVRMQDSFWDLNQESGSWND